MKKDAIVARIAFAGRTGLNGTTIHEYVCL
jgi:hypothetical protein